MIEEYEANARWEESIRAVRAESGGSSVEDAYATSPVVRTEVLAAAATALETAYTAVRSVLASDPRTDLDKAVEQAAADIFTARDALVDAQRLAVAASQRRRS